MNHRFTLSIFTVEINGTPTVALQAARMVEQARQLAAMLIEQAEKAG